MQEAPHTYHWIHIHTKSNRANIIIQTNLYFTKPLMNQWTEHFSPWCVQESYELLSWLFNLMRSRLWAVTPAFRLLLGGACAAMTSIMRWACGPYAAEAPTVAVATVPGQEASFDVTVRELSGVGWLVGTWMINPFTKWLATSYLYSGMIIQVGRLLGW